MKQKHNQQNTRAVLAELKTAGEAIEISRVEYEDYGLMIEPAVTLADALTAALDEQQQEAGNE